MKSGTIILGAVLPCLSGVAAKRCFDFDEKAHPLQWNDIGGDEIRQRYISNVCGLISTSDDWHEDEKHLKIKQCMKYGDNKVELELTSLGGQRTSYENCRTLLDGVTRQCAFGGDMILAVSSKETKGPVAKVLLNILKGSC